MALVWTQWRDHSETNPPISQLHLMPFWLVEGPTAFHYQCHISIRIAPIFFFFFKPSVNDGNLST